MNNMRIRQSDLISEDKLKNFSVNIYGVGGIGSHLALALARMGIKNIRLYDNDVVDEHNVSSQGFDYEDIGKYKTDAVADACFRAVRMYPFTKVGFVDGTSEILNADVHILAVDSMKSRLDIVENISSRFYKDTTVVNAAMSAEYMTMQVYNGSPSSIVDRFKRAWFSDEDAAQERCTAKATIYTTLLTSGYITKVCKDILMGNEFTKNLVLDIASNTVVSAFSSDGKSLLD